MTSSAAVRDPAASNQPPRLTAESRAGGVGDHDPLGVVQRPASTVPGLRRHDRRSMRGCRELDDRRAAARGSRGVAVRGGTAARPPRTRRPRPRRCGSRAPASEGPGSVEGSSTTACGAPPRGLADRRTRSHRPHRASGMRTVIASRSAARPVVRADGPARLPAPCRPEEPTVVWSATSSRWRMSNGLVRRTRRHRHRACRPVAGQWRRPARDRADTPIEARRGAVLGTPPPSGVRRTEARGQVDG